MILAGGYSVDDVRAQLGTTGAIYPEVCQQRAREMAREEASLRDRAAKILRTGQITRIEARDAFRFVGREGDREYVITAPIPREPWGQAGSLVGLRIVRELREQLRREAARGQP